MVQPNTLHSHIVMQFPWTPNMPTDRQLQGGQRQSGAQLQGATCVNLPNLPLMGAFSVARRMSPLQHYPEAVAHHPVQVQQRLGDEREEQRGCGREHEGAAPGRQRNLEGPPQVGRHAPQVDGGGKLGQLRQAVDEVQLLQDLHARRMSEACSCRFCCSPASRCTSACWRLELLLHVTDPAQHDQKMMWTQLHAKVSGTNP